MGICVWRRCADGKEEVKAWAAWGLIGWVCGVILG